MELLFKEDIDKYRFTHLSEVLLFIPYGVTVDKFQHFVYAHPEASAQERKAAWREIEKNTYPIEIMRTMIIGTTAAQSYIKQKFEEELWKNKIFTPVDEVISRGQKHERIISLEPEVKKGHILFNPGNIRCNNQVKDYNKGAKHDDAPDSLYGAVQLVEGVKSIRLFDRSLLF